ncbi:hypothetical protein Barb4_02870 [Bacteroidales bacterium Barb4]|nr:hypothetical protein Barb4_02870 [Bacteroidales bacterium Barb4]
MLQIATNKVEALRFIIRDEETLEKFITVLGENSNLLLAAIIIIIICE